MGAAQLVASTPENLARSVLQPVVEDVTQEKNLSAASSAIGYLRQHVVGG